MLMHLRRCEPLPWAFCWTRFGAEAGESIEQILVRKDAERFDGGGIFYWGIGNAVGPALAALVAEIPEPEVLFSPIKSPPRQVDVAPSSTVRWSAGQGLFGETFDLPQSACVTSRWEPARPNAARYALVCASGEPLVLADRGELRFGAMRNLSSGAPVGASQVTAVVRHDDGESGRTYPVALRASLVWPFVVRLLAPVHVVNSGQVELVEPQPLQLAI